MVGFSQFIRERQYLPNVTPATVEWYAHSFKWLHTPSPSQDELKDAVLRMREKGLKATGCISAIRAINAYMKWSGSPLKIPQMKEPQIVLPTFTAAQVSRLVNLEAERFLPTQAASACAHPARHRMVNHRGPYTARQRD